MLKGISPLIQPELLKILDEMGHGDEIVFADAHYPAHSQGVPVLRSDGIGIPALLRAVLPLLELDAYVEAPVLMMAAVPGDAHDPDYDAEISGILREFRAPGVIGELSREEFYIRSRGAAAIVVTGELRKYGNLILKKGVTPVPAAGASEAR